MANFLDYLDWRGDLSLAQAPMNAVDGLALAWLASLPWREPVPETVGGAADALAAVEMEPEKRDFLNRMAQSSRFGGMKLTAFEQKFSVAEEMQFAAITILTGDGLAFAAFRGTDSSLVGWKEDFNMAFSDEVPAQREAARYLRETAERIPLPLRVGGHSKGGNLAMYAAARVPAGVRRRIRQVWNFDGPGLSAATVGSSGFREIETRVETWLPESSVVGILLERTAEYHVVKSDGLGVMQHDPATWQVMRDDFVRLDNLNRMSLYADRTFREWLNSMSRDQRMRLVEALYDVVGATGAQRVGDLAERWNESGWELLNGFSDLDLRTKGLLFLALARLIRSALKNRQREEEESR